MPYCHTCRRALKPLGTPNHRAAHRRRHENCTITLASGTWEYRYADDPPQKAPA